MALSRWSHSRWYIYETEDDCLQICGDGYVSLSDLKNNFDQTISSLTKDESEYDRQELICYLKAWIDFKNGNQKRGNNKINFLRRKGELRNYLNYRILPNFIKNDKTNPKEVWDFLENNKNKKITIDDLDSIYVKIEKVEKHKLGLYNISFSFFNAKNIKVYDEARMLSSSNFLFKE